MAEQSIINENEVRSLLENPDEERLRQLLIIEKAFRDSRRNPGRGPGKRKVDRLPDPSKPLEQVVAPGRKPWEMLPNEAPLWYERFTVFKGLGPKRKVNGAFKVYKEQGLLTGVRAHQAWSGAAKDWLWRKRAEAWDLALLEESEQMEAQHRWESQTRRRFLADQALGKAFQAFLNARIDELSMEEARKLFPDIARFFKDVMGIDRVESGYHNYRLDASGVLQPGDEQRPMTVEAVVQGMRELEQWKRERGMGVPTTVEGTVNGNGGGDAK